MRCPEDETPNHKSLNCSFVVLAASQMTGVASSMNKPGVITEELADLDEFF